MKSKASKKAATVPKTVSPDQRAELVRQRAYEIWESCGCPHGYDQENWLQAEREVAQICGGEIIP